MENRLSSSQADRATFDLYARVIGNISDAVLRQSAFSLAFSVLFLASAGFGQKFFEPSANFTPSKENGGKIYNNMNKDGVQGAAYKFKEYYYIEACGEAICWRNYSSELNAVRVFAANFPNGSTKTKKYKNE